MNQWLFKSGLPRRAALLCLGLALGGFVLRQVGRRFTRYEVRGESMLPALSPGDYVIIDLESYKSRLPRRGEILLLHDPRDHQREIIKRVRWADPGGVWVEGDNAGASTDSRQFGPVAPELLIGRMRWRYWRAGNFPT